VADAWAEGLNLNQDRVLIAIGGNGLDYQAVPRSLPLQPELLAGAAVKGGKARFDGLAEGFVIHIPHHEDATRRMVLNDGCDQPTGFFKIEIHRVPNKKPAGGRLASRGGRPFNECFDFDQNTARRTEA
jgi:hypothetical protein